MGSVSFSDVFTLLLVQTHSPKGLSDDGLVALGIDVRFNLIHTKADKSPKHVVVLVISGVSFIGLSNRLS